MYMMLRKYIAINYSLDIWAKEVKAVKNPLTIIQLLKSLKSLCVERETIKYFPRDICRMASNQAWSTIWIIYQLGQRGIGGHCYSWERTEAAVTHYGYAWDNVQYNNHSKVKELTIKVRRDVELKYSLRLDICWNHVLCGRSSLNVRHPEFFFTKISSSVVRHSW